MKRIKRKNRENLGCPDFSLDTIASSLYIINENDYHLLQGDENLPRRRCARHGLREQVDRWTLPRDVILDILSSSKGHLSAKEIYDALYSTHPGIGLTTVYRTLELFQRLGVVQKITTPDGQARYELKTEENKGHHHHLICLRCGKIIDYDDFAEEELELVKKTEKALSKKHNFSILDHHIEFLGLCEKCRKAAGEI